MRDELILSVEDVNIGFDQEPHRLYLYTRGYCAKLLEQTFVATTAAALAASLVYSKYNNIGCYII
jgi:hypothetical protein